MGNQEKIDSRSLQNTRKNVGVIDNDCYTNNFDIVLSANYSYFELVII